MIVTRSSFSCLLAAALLSTPAPALEFEEVTGLANIDDAGETYGASWGDVNADNYPDVWLSKHQYAPSVLLVNNGDGTFDDLTAQLLDTDYPKRDTHGAAWADFDNNGTDDLVELTGGGAGASLSSRPVSDNWRNSFYLNSGGFLSERAADYGLQWPRGRSRSPLWFDFDGDSNLDVLFTTIGATDVYTSTIFRQLTEGDQPRFTTADPTSGTPYNRILGYDIGACAYAVLTDLNGDLHQDLICANTKQVRNVYDISRQPFVDITAQLGPDLFRTGPHDIATADFNGDLKIDVIGVYGVDWGSMVIQPSTRQLNALLNPQGGTQEFTFTSPDAAPAATLDFEFGWPTKSFEIYLGEQGAHPVWPDTLPRHVQFTLSEDDNSLLGLHPQASRSPGIYIGRNAGTKQWTVRVTGFRNKRGMIIRSSRNMIDLAATPGIRFNQGAPLAQALHINEGGQLVNRSQSWGLSGFASHCQSVTVADFDNDMDVDAYLGCTGQVANLPNILLENLGDRFAIHADPFDRSAAGSSEGKTDVVTSVDYDLDGRVDLFVTQGRVLSPFSYQGHQQLFRNVTDNVNNWIQLDLEGVTVNRDAIGATVFATTPDGVVQIRENNGRMHKFAQDHRLVHFGLGPNRSADITVRWPDGREEIFRALAANQFHHLLEGSSDSPPSSQPQPGDECGEPTVRSADRGLFLHRDCPSGQWYLTASSGGQGWTTYSGIIEADVAFDTAPVPVGFERNDVVELSSDGRAIRFELHVGPANDGFTFGISDDASRVCLSSVLPDHADAALGAAKAQVVLPYDIHAMGDCDSTPHADLTCGDPHVDGRTDRGLFLWRECPTNQWRALVAAGNDTGGLSYQGRVLASFSGPATPLMLERGDALSTNDDLDVVSYRMFVQGAGRDGLAFDVADPANGCFCLDNVYDGGVDNASVGIIVGEMRVPSGRSVPLSATARCACEN
ncbi:MAG: CRTAC1 family protein [Thiohalocapsa sp.]|nr:CRTAC1 family protein [Thiohalocapsa sp.]